MKVGFKLFMLAVILIAFVYWIKNHSGYFPYEHNPMQYMPNMHRSAALKPMRASEFFKDGMGARTPPEGSIARDVEYSKTSQDIPAENVERRGNPFSISKEVVLRGRQVYSNTCIVCHGPSGAGDGPVVPPYPKPPSLTSDKIRALADSQIFHIITNGQNTMRSYASQIREEDRWKIIHYVRVLQMAQNPTAEQLKAFEDFGVNANQEAK